MEAGWHDSSRGIEQNGHAYITLIYVTAESPRFRRSLWENRPENGRGEPHSAGFSVSNVAL